MGTSYYRITFPADPDDGRLVIDFEGQGYNTYTAYYPNGKVRERGECLVDTDFQGLELYPDDHNVLWCKCYKPDGTVGSEVKDGTGVQTRWSTDGQKRLELCLKDCRWERYRVWYPNGQLLVDQSCLNGELDGIHRGFHPNGKTKFEGEFDQGTPIGTWRHYNADGSLRKVGHHPSSEDENVK